MGYNGGMTKKRVLSVLSTSLLVLGALFILGGLAWTAWQRWQQPPVPVESAAGAVVLARAAPDALGLPAPVAASSALELPAPAIVSSPKPRAVPATAYRQQPQRLMEPAGLPTAVPKPLPTASPTPPPPPEPPTRIVAPAIKLDAKVVPTGYHLVKRGGRAYTEWLVPKDGAGWHDTSAPPGRVGNTVISGHHNIEGKVFRYVVDLEPGDTVTLYAGDKAYDYVVVEKYILKEAGMPQSVREKNAQWIAATGDIRLTLVTCWPYQWPGNTHRVVVVAKPAW